MAGRLKVWNAAENEWQYVGGAPSMALSTTLSGDGDYSGITESGIAGTTLVFGELVYLAVADSRWEKAKADSVTTSAGKLGICVLAAAADGSATTILLYGKINAASLFPTLIVGAPVFISATSSGAVVVAKPSGTVDWVVRCVGQANTADELFFNPSPDYITLAS